MFYCLSHFFHIKNLILVAFKLLTLQTRSHIVGDECMSHKDVINLFTQEHTVWNTQA